MARIAGRILCSITVLMLILSGLSAAQVPDPAIAAAAPVPGAGHHYIGTGGETVNPADGSLSFDLPFDPPPGRGLSMKFGIRFSGTEEFYLSNQFSGTGSLTWYPDWQNGQAPWQRGGWSYDLPIVTAQTSIFTFANVPTNGCPNGVCTFHLDLCYGSDGYIFRGLTGQQYSLHVGLIFKDPNNVQLTCSPSNGNSVGNTHGIVSSLQNGVTVVDQSGTTYQFPGAGAPEPIPPLYTPAKVGSLASSITDRNGNQIVLSGNSYKDSTGRTAISWTGIGNNGDTITVAGLGSPVTLKWTTTPVSFPETGYNLSSVSPCTIASPPSQTNSISVVNEIDLPNTTKYTFQYDGIYGEVSRINFPGGGYVRYVWGLNHSAQQTRNSWNFNTTPLSCNFVFDVPAITDRYVSYDGANEVLHQQFSYSTTWPSAGGWTSKTTTVTNTDLVTGQITKTIYSYSPTSTDPTVYSGSGFSYLNKVPVETNVLYEDGTSKVYKEVNKSWASPEVMVGQQTILYDSLGNRSVGNATQSCYDTNEQITNFLEYGFQTEGAKPADPSCYSTPPKTGSLNNSYIGPLRRQTTTAYHPYFSWNGSTSPATWSGTHIVNAPDSNTVADAAGNIAKQSTFSYTNSVTPPVPATAVGLVSPPGTDRGNIASIIKRVDASTSVTSTYAWFDNGQLKSMTDPCGNTTCADMTGANHTTSYSYTDNYASGTGTPPGQTNAYLTQVTLPNTFFESFTWGYNDGQIRSRTDQNSRTSTFLYSDPGLLGRLSEIDSPDGGQTTVTYNDATYNSTNNTPSFTTTNKITSTTNLVNTTAFDGMGKTARALLTSDPDGTDTAETGYDGMGHARTQSNPHRTVSSSTDGTSTTTYDALGRVCLVSPQDIASPPTSCPASAPAGSVFTSYSGSCTTVTDNAGKSRKSCTDGLGRLTQVFEDPSVLNYETDYQYDVLDNLMRVDQKGGSANSGDWRTRTFTYDSLSRLLTASNPESGTLTYTYDANSNVSTKVAPLPNKIPADTSSPQTVTTTYTYDTLNRLTQKSYNDTPQTPTVKYGYDGVALTGCTTTPPTLTDSNPKGRRTSMCDGSGATTWALDITTTGWKTTESRIINGVNKTIVSQNNLGGMLSTLTYPSGRMVTFFPSTAGRVTDVKDTANSFNYVTAATYAPPGGVASFNNGASVKFTEIYNNRVQPCWIYATTGTALATSTLCTGSTSAGNLIDLKYNFNWGTTNNGNVMGITNNRVTGRTQSFTYDALNRIATGQSQATSGTDCWGQSFTIDAWGNLTNETVTKCSAPPLNAPATTKNQISGYCYDLAGNLLGTSACPSLPYTPTYTYDAEGQLRGVGGVTYAYDGDGHRVKKSSGTLYWGAALAESDLTGSTASWKDYIFFSGARVAKRDSTTTHYFFSDELGSTSVVRNDSTGSLEEDMVYSPYGVTLSGTSADHYLFNGKERDTESGFDEYGARYYSSAQGRFTIPDWAAKPTAVPYANYGNPQSLNLFSYVQNNPTTLGDPDGHCVEDLCIGEAVLVSSAIAYLSTPAGRQSVVNFFQSADKLLDKAAASIANAIRKDNTSDQPANSSGQAGEKPVVHEVDPAQHPEAAEHVREAQAAGQPTVITVGSRAGNAKRHREAVKGTAPVKGMDRDIYPPAWSAEAGANGSTKVIDSSDNRGSGGSMGQTVKDLPEGTKVEIRVKPGPPKKEN